ncbi:B12-binding domain-containing radical SAM protein [Candidatus Woesearchaeota archaeon]|nr:B12-binding domain-containing radical SAM protein [Candidatus Woesearchaeota archaeon]
MRVAFVYKNAEWLGVEYLVAVLREAGHEVELLFDSGVGDIEFKLNFLKKYMKSEEIMLEKARKFKPQLIAVSCLNNLTVWAKHMCKLFKKEFNIPIMIGGLQPTMVPDMFFQDDWDIDIICRGEGEEAILELCNSMEKGEINYSIKNLWFKKPNGEIIRNEVRSLDRDLDTLPFPDKSIFYEYGAFKNRLYIMASRGCPYKCTYCFNHNYQRLYKGLGNYVRFRKPEKVIDEVLHFKKKFPSINEVFFYDDNFTLKKIWTLELCKRYKERVYDVYRIPFKCLVRADQIDIDIARALKESGCIYVDIGVESGDEYVRNEILKRNMNDEEIIKAANCFHEVGLAFTTLNMVGFPGETPEQMIKTIELNQRIKPTAALITTFFPFPKTDLAERSLREGYINESNYRKMIEGHVSYKEGTILDHPYKREIMWVWAFFPIVVKYPKLMPLLKRLPPHRFFRLISTFFSTPRRNYVIRLMETVSMISNNIKRSFIFSLNKWLFPKVSSKE